MGSNPGFLLKYFFTLKDRDAELWLFISELSMTNLRMEADLKLKTPVVMAILDYAFTFSTPEKLQTDFWEYLDTYYPLVDFEEELNAIQRTQNIPAEAAVFEMAEVEAFLGTGIGTGAESGVETGTDTGVKTGAETGEIQARGTNAPQEKPFVVHEGKKPHVCSACGHAFVAKSKLKKHIECVHEGKKPYVGSTRGGVHRGRKPFKCHACDTGFPDKKILKRHFATVHEGKKA
jgi:hypothetical protein